MRIIFSDIRRAKRFARALHRELNKIGTDIGLTAAQNLAAKLYGYDSFHELKACVGKWPASEWDERCPPPVVDARREYQVGVLVRAGVDRTAAEAVVRLTKPTGTREDIKRKSGPLSIDPAAATAADLDAMLDEIVSRISVWGVSAEMAACIDSLLTKAYEDGADRVVIHSPGIDGLPRVRFESLQGELPADDLHEVPYKCFWRYLTHRSGIDPAATNDRGFFHLHRQDGRIGIRVSCYNSNGYTAIEAAFAKPQRAAPTLDMFSIAGFASWIGSFDGPSGLHLVCSKTRSKALLEAMSEQIGAKYARVWWGRTYQADFGVRYREAGKRDLVILTPENLGNLADRLIKTVTAGHQVVMVIDADSLEEALFLLIGMGYSRDQVRQLLRSIILPAKGQASKFAWEAHAFSAGQMPATEPVSVRNREAELAHLKSMRRSLEMGTTGILQVKMARHGWKLKSSPDDDIRLAYADLRDRADEAARIEAVHGKGCLMDLEHDVVRDLIGYDEPRNPPIITPEEIEAARRYRALSAGIANLLKPEDIVIGEIPDGPSAELAKAAAAAGHREWTPEPEGKDKEELEASSS